MIRECCGQLLIRWVDTPKFFQRKCWKCGTVYTQRKRQPASEEES